MTTLPATIQERIPLPEGGAPQEATGGITPRDVLAMLRRRMIMIILLWLLFSIVAVGVFFLCYVYFPKYRSEALIECISNRPDQAEPLTQEAVHKDEHTWFINSHAALIKSQEVLFDVLKTAEVRSTRWFAQWNDRPEQRPIALEDALLSGPVRDTNYIRVAMDCRVRTDPAIIVDQVVKVFLALVHKGAKAPIENELAGVAMDDLVPKDFRQQPAFVNANTGGRARAGLQQVWHNARIVEVPVAFRDFGVHAGSRRLPAGTGQLVFVAVVAELHDEIDAHAAVAVVIVVALPQRAE